MRYVRTFLKRWYLYMFPIIVIPIIVTINGYNSLLAYNCYTLLWVDKPVYLSAQDFGWNPYASPAWNEATAMNELLQSKTWVATVAAHTDLAQYDDLSTPGGKDAAFYRISGEVSISPTGVGPHALVLSVTDKSPKLALQLVQALMTEFTSDYQSQRVQLDQQAIAFYQQQLVTAQGQVSQDSQKIQEYLNAHRGIGVPGSGGAVADTYLAQLQQQLGQDQQQVNALNSEIRGLQNDTLATNSASSDIFKVLDPPQLPTTPTIEKRKLVETYTGGGLAAALALVGVIVAGLTQLDRKIYAIADVRVLGDDLELDLPTIEPLPLISGNGGSSRRSGGADDAIHVLVRTILPQLSDTRAPQGLWRAPSVPAPSVPSMLDGENRS